LSNVGQAHAGTTARLSAKATGADKPTINDFMS
jgi:hypothetical protein